MTTAHSLSAAKETADSGPAASIETAYALTDRTIDVYFGTSGFGLPSNDPMHPVHPAHTSRVIGEGFNAYEIGQFEQAFDIIESYVDVEFRTVGSHSRADFSLVLDTNQFQGNTLGYFYLPTGIDQYGVFNGARWDRMPGGDLEAGGVGFSTIVHELLHGLGLDHPFDGDHSALMRGVTRSSDTGFADLNQGVFTTMSYSEGCSCPDCSPVSLDGTFGAQAGPMALDIAVLQKVYGANMRTNAGDTVYTLHDRNKRGTDWRTIWDVNGHDTIRHHSPKDAIIDLRPATLRYEEGGGGFISTAKGISGGFTIANGVTVEAAIGGDGNDTLIGNNADNDLTGGKGNDTLIGGAGRDRAIYALDSSDLAVVEFGEKFRVVSDRFGTDELSGIETISTLDGDFTPEDLISGPVSSDNIAGDSGADALLGTSVGELIRGRGGNDTIRGSAGNDTLEGGVGFDRLEGGDGSDLLVGGNGFDTLIGGNGNDTLDGGFGNDLLVGEAGNNKLLGGLGFDELEGGTGDDTLIAADGFDTLHGGAGNDILKGNAGNDLLFGNSGDDRIEGGIGADTLYGGDGSELMLGGNGADRLLGEAGDDILRGNAGNDRLDGGSGNDRLQGGIGSDIFVFARGGDRDVIEDLGVVDSVELSGLVRDGQSLDAFATTINGALALDFGGGDVLIFERYGNLSQILNQIDIV